MEVQVLVENLRKPFAILAPIASRKAPTYRPYLRQQQAYGMSKLHTERGWLAVTTLAGDNHCVGTVTVGAKVDEEGACIVPTRLMADYTKALPPATMKITAKDSLDKKHTTEIVCARNTANIIGQFGADEYPVVHIPETEPGECVHYNTIINDLLDEKDAKILKTLMRGNKYLDIELRVWKTDKKLTVRAERDYLAHLTLTVATL